MPTLSTFSSPLLQILLLLLLLLFLLLRPPSRRPPHIASRTNVSTNFFAKCTRSLAGHSLAQMAALIPSLIVALLPSLIVALLTNSRTTQYAMALPENFERTASRAK